MRVDCLGNDIVIFAICGCNMHDTGTVRIRYIIARNHGVQPVSRRRQIGIVRENRRIMQPNQIGTHHSSQIFRVCKNLVICFDARFCQHINMSIIVAQAHIFHFFIHRQRRIRRQCPRCCCPRNRAVAVF